MRKGLVRQIGRESLVDSDWLIDAAAGKQAALQTLDQLSADGLAINIVAVAEV